MAPPDLASSALGVIKRRVKTPGEVFGLAVKHKVYYGTVVKRDKPRGDPPVECVTVRYDDGQNCWFPVTTVERWVLPVGAQESAPAESEDLSDESDPSESDQSDTEANTSASVKVVPTRRKSKKTETPAEKAHRLEHEERKARITTAIAESFRENKRAPYPDIPFKHTKSPESFHIPPDSSKPFYVSLRR
ncbi:hypothetical protein CYMTET_26176 [Cymbomonas tetramitiformis]|uniref:Uncharacterized protein n=1 Tax=Cymbomonas tetramitiformis TaxID=36881 RepID=A0AAE0FSL3_9CHLO|nr:hypothetical protein CYMTET_26176 [Cymbomonas tetramitiformis]